MEDKWRQRSKIVAYVDITLVAISLVSLGAVLMVMLAYLGQGYQTEPQDKTTDPFLWLDDTGSMEKDSKTGKLPRTVLIYSVLFGVGVGLLFGLLLLLAAFKLLKSTRAEADPNVSLKNARFWRCVKFFAVGLQVLYLIMMLASLKFPIYSVGLILDLVFIYIVTQYMDSLRTASASQQYAPPEFHKNKV